MSRERPILFSAPMVLAILDGRKTQTRRLVNPRHYTVLGRGHNETCDNGLVSIPCPYGKPGDRLWVRETWTCLGPALTENLFYRSDRKDDDMPIGRAWRPSIHMPRWASRITLEITDVRVQRLQDISEEDVLAEGVTKFARGMRASAHASFASLWDSINGDRAPWTSNPWVWALTFKRLPAAEASKA